MRIAQISTLNSPVMEHGAESIESLIYGLSKELMERGHDVTVFASGDSTPPCKLDAALPGPYGQKGSPGDWHLCEWVNLANAVKRSGQFDILHSHGYLWGIPLDGLSLAPIVHTLHITPHEDECRLVTLSDHSHVVATSAQQWDGCAGFRPMAMIYNGVDISQYTYREEADDYLGFIGRFIPQKGALEAIEIAKRVGMRLKIAARRNDYFDAVVAPHVDGEQIEYVGFLNGREKDKFLGGAAAILYPITQPEPFGLVLVEAMLCGTPVVGSDLGAVPEIVKAGVSGYYSTGQLDDLVEKAVTLDRKAVRGYADDRFSLSAMADGYLDVYRQLIDPVRTGASN